MFSNQVRLLCFLLALPYLLGNPDAQRSRVDENLRGNSFGLENFLFQPYENVDVVRVVKTKRIRPVNRGQTFGLENAQLYESSRVKPTQEHVRRRPVEPTAESNRIRENFVVSPETVPEVTQEPEAKPTERIRKRIMMRRRRKRPSNPTQPEGEIIGNAILKPVRIPVYPQISKVVVRTKSSTQEVVKPIPTEETEITEPAEPQTTVTEKAIISTTKTPATTTAKPSTINLKTFLKQQTETLSLSELLQTQNLSLADLLRGNKDASAILRGRQAITSTTQATIRRKQFTREQERTEHTPKTAEILEATTSRPNYNGFYPKIPRIKPNEEVTSRLEEPPKAIKRPVYGSSPPSGSDPQNRLNELRTKLRNFQKKTSPPSLKTEVTSEPPASEEPIEPVSAAPKSTEAPSPKKNRISYKSTNNPELSVILPNKVKPEQESQKKPERLSNWTNRLPSIKRFGQERPRQTEPPPTTLVSIPEERSEEELETTPPTEEEIRKPEPKDELVELLKSGQNADRLQKILNSRNMTIQELLDNREKPPLQMDISTLFSQQRKQTTAQPTLFDSLPDFSLDENERPTSYDEPEAEESAPSIARVQPIPNREAKQFEFPVPVSPINLQTDDLTADRSNPEDTPLWKLSEKAIYYGSSYGYGEFPAVPQTDKPKPEPSESDIIFLETIRTNQDSNGKFKLDLKDFIREEEEPVPEDIEKSYIPPAVKSAIIASGVVMGIALFVFIAIFAACGWKQRQIRLKGTSSVLGGTLNKPDKSRRTLSPVSFKDNNSYKKTIDFDEETSESGTSNTSSYLWSTLKNTFTSRASTLKSRLEKEEKVREDKVTLRRNESRRKESRADDRSTADDVYVVKKIDRDRNVINTSFNFKRSQNNNNFGHFNECVHGY